MTKRTPEEMDRSRARGQVLAAHNDLVVALEDAFFAAVEGLVEGSADYAAVEARLHLAIEEADFASDLLLAPDALRARIASWSV